VATISVRPLANLLVSARHVISQSVSVLVRHTLIQLLTPDEMRGRISVVNNIFIGSSNEFGAVESG
jgi:hypothetical protein